MITAILKYYAGKALPGRKVRLIVHPSHYTIDLKWYIENLPKEFLKRIDIETGPVANLYRAYIYESDHNGIFCFERANLWLGEPR